MIGRRAWARLAGPLVIAGCSAPDRAPLPEDPGEAADPVLRLAAARALDEGGYPRAAIDRVDAVLAARPDDLEALREKARLHLRLAEERAALAALDRILAVRPDDRDALFQAGVARARIGDDDAAIAHLDRYARIVPGDPEGRRALGFALYLRARRTGSEADLARAEAEYRAALSLDPGSAALHHDLGSLLAERGEAEAAEAEYRAALERDPGHLAATEAIASILAEARRWEEAEPLAKGAIERERDPRRRDRLEAILDGARKGGADAAPAEP